MKLDDLSGNTFGRLVVIRRSANHVLPCGQQSTQWLCKCDCGKVLSVRGADLKSGNTSSCGCIHREVLSKISFVDISGMSFGNLTVIGRSKIRYTRPGGRSESFWDCRCNCGNITKVLSSNLKSGKIKSCGCLSESFIAQELKNYCKINYNASLEYKLFQNPDTGQWLRCDIFIPPNVFVEINGLQHYMFIKFFHKTENKFLYNQRLDKIKRDYMEKNGKYIEIDLRIIKTLENSISYLTSYIRSF